MIKRKFVLYVSALVVLMTAFFALGGCGRQSSDNVAQGFSEVVYDHVTASVIFYETTLEGLLYRASNVVRGRVVDSTPQTVLLFHEHDPSIFVMGHTLIMLEVYEVMAGADVAVGDVITIMEPYYVKDDILFTHRNYLPSTPGQEYIFFLSEPRPETAREELRGAFAPVHGERARYLVPSDRAAMRGYSARELSLARETVHDFPVSELYMQLWHDVVEEFVSVSNVGDLPVAIEESGRIQSGRHNNDVRIEVLP